jgi:hypothetical protein
LSSTMFFLVVPGAQEAISSSMERVRRFIVIFNSK